MIKKAKKELRMLGIDDSPFNKNKDKRVLIVGTIFRGGDYLDGLLSCYVKVDGNDSTNKLIKMIKKTRHLDQLQCIMLNGIALGGFNVIDIHKLAKKTKLAVIVVIRRMPDIDKIKKVLMKIKMKSKIKLIEKAGRVYPVKIKNKSVYIQIAGIDLGLAKKIVKLSATHSLIPEPIRASHIISSGIVSGESHGRA